MQYENHKTAIKILEEIDKNPSSYLIIHYSCEAFTTLKMGMHQESLLLLYIITHQLKHNHFLYIR